MICNMKRYRKAKKLTQEELAEITELSVSTIKNLECNRYGPSQTTAILIAKFLDVEIEDLWVSIK